MKPKTIISTKKEIKEWKKILKEASNKYLKNEKKS
jgi:hypothetical protein